NLTASARMSITLASLAARDGDRAGARALIVWAREVSVNTGSTDIEMEVARLEARLLCAEGSVGEAIDLLHRQLELADSTQHPMARVTVLSTLGLVHIA